MFVNSCQKEDHDCKKQTFRKRYSRYNLWSLSKAPHKLIKAIGTGERTPIGKSSFLGQAQIDASNNFTDDRIITTANGDQIFETAKGPGPIVDVYRSSSQQKRCVYNNPLNVLPCFENMCRYNQHNLSCGYFQR
jgi:hypothetical protein